MLRLSLMMFSFIGTTLMGIGVIIVLAIGMGTAMPIMLAAATGFIAAIPASWLVARQMLMMKR